MKVRIGTDLRLLVTLTSNLVEVNIKSLKAYLINKTLKKKIEEDLKKKTRFISRYPIEPMTDSYIATHYNVNGCGYPSYNVYPYRKMCIPYCGFGVEPHFDMIYPTAPEYRFATYVAEVKATTAKDKVEVIFPAEAQFAPGEFDIVIVAKLYYPGYNHNIKTVTADYPNAFTLVESSAEEDSEASNVKVTIINEDIVDGGEAPVTDKYVFSGLHDGDRVLKLKLTDGSVVQIDTSSASGWYVGD